MGEDGGKGGEGGDVVQQLSDAGISDAEIIITYTPPQAYYDSRLDLPTFRNNTPLLTAKYRSRTKRQVEDCQGCELWDRGYGPLPMTVGDGAKGKLARFAVVGEAPAVEADRKREVMIGPGGRLLKNVMINQDMDPDDGVWINTVSCCPRDKEMGKIRVPSDDEMMSCRKNLMGQLEASGARVALLVGSNAVRAFRPDLQVTKTNASVFVWHLPWGDVLVMPAIHPLGVLKQHSQMDHLKLAVGLFGDLVEEVNDNVESPESFDILDWLEVACVRCDKGVYCWDRDGVAYCEEHWEKYRFNWKRADEKWNQGVDWTKVRIRGARKKAVQKGKNVDENQDELFEEI